jgi:hypothetical protein
MLFIPRKAPRDEGELLCIVILALILAIVVAFNLVITAVWFLLNK